MSDVQLPVFVFESGDAFRLLIVDERLQEFRPADNPSRSIPFSDYLGEFLYDQWLKVKHGPPRLYRTDEALCWTCLNYKNVAEYCTRWLQATQPDQCCDDYRRE